MMSDLKFSFLIATAIIFGLTIALAYESCGSLINDCIVGTAHDWQALIAGAIALVAAFGTIYQVHSHRRKDRLQKAISYRTTLTFTLSEICEWAEQEKQTLSESLSGGPLPEIQRPSEFESYIETVRINIEYTDDDIQNADKLRALIHKMQVHFARRKGNYFRTEHSLTGLMLDCAAIYAIASSLFEHARGSDFRKLEPSYEEISSALRNLGCIDEDTDPELYARLNQRYQLISQQKSGS